MNATRFLAGVGLGEVLGDGFLQISEKYFYGQPLFWTGASFVASCGGVSVEHLKRCIENQAEL